jgi:hypothetical protein
MTIQSFDPHKTSAENRQVNQHAAFQGVLNAAETGNLEKFVQETASLAGSYYATDNPTAEQTNAVMRSNLEAVKGNRPDLLVKVAALTQQALTGTQTLPVTEKKAEKQRSATEGSSIDEGSSIALESYRAFVENYFRNQQGKQ